MSDEEILRYGGEHGGLRLATFHLSMGIIGMGVAWESGLVIGRRGSAPAG